MPQTPKKKKFTLTNPYHKSIKARSAMAGLFFCLASAEGAWLLFCPAAIQPHTIVYSAFCSVNAILYRPRHKTARRALQALFMQFVPLSRHRYQTDTSSYNTVCATLERIHAPGRSPAHTRYQRRAGRCTGQHRPPIIIMYIRGSCAPQSWIHARPAGSRCFPRPAACDLAPGQPGTLHPAGQSSSWGAAGGAEPLAALAAALFGLSPDSQ